MPFRDAWLIVGGLLLLAGFAAGEPAIAAVGLVVVVLGGVSRYWSRHLFDRVTLDRKAGERRGFVGEAIPLEVTLENRKPLPLPWFEWRLGMAETLKVEAEQVASAVVPGLHWLVRKGALGWYQRQQWKFTMRPTERGFHQIGPATIRSSDLLGVFPRAHEDDTEDHLIIFPHVLSLEDLGLPSDRPFGERKGGERIFEDPLRIAGLREYRPGDPLKRIDWKATARDGELRSRVYEPSATQQIYLMVNIDTMLHAWEGYLRNELERVVSAAASVAVWAAGARYAVGILANGAFPNADRPIRLPPSRSRDQVTRVLEALAVVQPLTMGDLAGAIEREASRIPRGSTIVIIASLLPERLCGVIARLHSEGHSIFVLGTSHGTLDALPPGIPGNDVSRVFERLEAAG